VEASEERNALLKELVKINRGMVAAMVGIQEGIEEQNALQFEGMREHREFREKQRVGALALKRAVDGVRDELRNYLQEQGWKTDSGASEEPGEEAENEVVVEEVDDLLEEGRKDAREAREGANADGDVLELGELRVEIRDAEGEKYAEETIEEPAEDM
jgi:hypothetical protein